MSSFPSFRFSYKGGFELSMELNAIWILVMCILVTEIRNIGSNTVAESSRKDLFRRKSLDPLHVFFRIHFHRVL